MRPGSLVSQPPLGAIRSYRRKPASSSFRSGSSSLPFHPLRTWSFGSAASWRSAFCIFRPSDLRRLWSVLFSQFRGVFRRGRANTDTPRGGLRCDSDCLGGPHLCPERRLGGPGTILAERGGSGPRQLQDEPFRGQQCFFLTQEDRGRSIGEVSRALAILDSLPDLPEHGSRLPPGGHLLLQPGGKTGGGQRHRRCFPGRKRRILVSKIVERPVAQRKD